MMFIIFDNLVEEAKSGDSQMEPTSSPVGRTSSSSRERRARNPEYLAEQRRLAQFEEIARTVIMHRTALDLSQVELAKRMKTSHSAVSRLESGEHKTSVQTLQRVAEALGLRFVMSFENGPAADIQLPSPDKTATAK